MQPNFLIRRAVQLGLTANALRPPNTQNAAFPVFFAGWLTGELAPQLLALTAADTALHLARHGKHSSRAGVAMAAASAAGLGALMRAGHGARAEVEAALTEALGDSYADELGRSDLGLPWRELAMPFRMSSPEVRVDRNIAYAPGGRRFLLDVYRPAGPVTGAPVLLQVHGGAWVIGNKEEQGRPLMRYLARRGWVCVAINYPLSPSHRWPAHIVAAKRSLAWIRSHIEDYGGDPEFVAVTGGSAGGHLASLLALTPNDPVFQPDFPDVDTSVQACVPHYGVYDFAATSGSRASQYRLENLLARRIFAADRDPVRFLDDYIAASPLDRVTEDAPPFFVVHGASDSNSRARSTRSTCSRRSAARTWCAGWRASWTTPT